MQPYYRVRSTVVSVWWQSCGPSPVPLPRGGAGKAQQGWGQRAEGRQCLWVRLQSLQGVCVQAPPPASPRALERGVGCGGAAAPVPLRQLGLRPLPHSAELRSCGAVLGAGVIQPLCSRLPHAAALTHGSPASPVPSSVLTAALRWPQLGCVGGCRRVPPTCRSSSQPPQGESASPSPLAGVKDARQHPRRGGRQGATGERWLPQCPGCPTDVPVRQGPSLQRVEHLTAPLPSAEAGGSAQCLVLSGQPGVTADPLSSCS